MYTIAVASLEQWFVMIQHELFPDVSETNFKTALNLGNPVNLAFGILWHAETHITPRDTPLVDSDFGFLWKTFD